MLLTTHYMEEAELLCDRLAIMDHGHILEMGTVQELVSKRFQERAVQFDSLEAVADERSRRDAGGDVRSSTMPACRCSTRGTSRRPSGRCWPSPKRAGWNPRTSLVRRATLEDVFLDLTGRALRD